MIAAALPLLAALAAAQTAPAPLSWEDCVALALRRNPDLAASNSAAAAGRADYRGSFNALMPSVSLSNRYADSTGAGRDSRWSASASAELSLLDAGAVAGIRSASASYDQARAAARSVSASLRYALRQAHARLLYSQSAVEVSRTIRDLRAKGARLVALRYESGRESKGNRLRAAAQLSQAEAELSQAARGVRSDQRGLARQLGLEDAAAVVAATGTLSAAAAPAPPADLPALASRRPDLAVSEAARRRAEAALSSARSVYWPTVSADYTRSRTGAAEFPSARASWSGGVTLRLPILGGGPTAAYYEAQAARRRLEQADYELSAARQEALADLESAWSAYAGAYDQVAVQQALLEAARQRNDEADIRYASGLMSYDSWEIIASDRINSERRALSARLDAVVAEAAWDRALGKELGQ